ncbi:carcinine transporter-like [Neodiprion pinetum]|uniref:Carcinine transporter n=1 Tax=Neodiprion lecontei TaxID=441921 RepID=A0A6J0B9S0_NEOLC|nr:carcinine transporter [Neodiprion lecontei]XP_015511709.1 carcinine transporter [Neodiprion lecontei]XP_046421287.1 carcinine transporter-like [Neodiprion fabricii]XP_046421288.1 carcinine transporter-like [Neodiprion fabricii]XP_046421289.1 carcinine transporter-like [Neodiprion fabricii]XP_046421290.1 carcinine transporter-like [Neodiprion fabricii]XP_046477641.1 carcinine transporter-like [Neodiprion pinetum]XP_046477642.1 carcinine transporter-like [Neodiprion pinetum]XP_046477643.1 
MTVAVEPSKVEDGKRSKIENFDDILPYIGEAGRYQWLLFILLLPFTVVYAFLYFTQFFLTLTPEQYWCKVPELDGWNLTDHEKIALSIPAANADELKLEGATAVSRCQMYAVNYTELLMTGVRVADPSWATTKCEHGWSFNYTNIPYASIAAELEWVCDKTYLSSAAQSAFFAGSMIGGLVFGYVADHYGRIPALVACNAVGFFASIATVFANSFWSFCLCRLVVGTAFDNCFNILFIIVIEYVGPKYRTLIANLSFGIYFAVASSILPWIAYWIADWRILSVVTAAPLAIAFVGPWIVPESARWYISSGKVDKAIDMLKRFERVNGKTVQPEIYEEFRESCNNIIKNDKSHNNYTVLDLFKKPRLARITVMLIIWWLAMIIVFDGHVWNMKLLDPNVFMSFSLAALTELPAAIILAILLDRWGRRWMSFLSLAMCGIFSFIAVATPAGGPTVIMAIFARLGVNIAANIGFQYAAEMLPTVVRAQGVSLIHIIGYFAHIIGPYIVYLADVAPQLPLVVLGLLSMSTAFLTLFLPETLDQDLPESLQEGNDFGKEQSFWWIPCISRTPEKKKAYRKKLGVTNAGFNPGSLSRIDSTKL